MSQHYLGYHRLLAVRKSTTNGTYGAVLDCWVVPTEFTEGGLGVYLHDDGNIYNCLLRSSFTGGKNDYASSAEFTCAGDAYDAAVAYCKRHGYVYAFALSDDKCYNLNGSSTDVEPQVMEFG